MCGISLSAEVWEREREIGIWDGVQRQEYPNFTQAHSCLIPHRSRWSHQVVHQLVCTDREGQKQPIRGGESVEEVYDTDLLLPLHQIFSNFRSCCQQSLSLQTRSNVQVYPEGAQVWPRVPCSCHFGKHLHPE